MWHEAQAPTAAHRRQSISLSCKLKVTFDTALVLACNVNISELQSRSPSTRFGFTMQSALRRFFHLRERDNSSSEKPDTKYSQMFWQSLLYRCPHTRSDVAMSQAFSMAEITSNEVSVRRLVCASCGTAHSFTLTSSRVLKIM
jgi:hypothetical protein